MGASRRGEREPGKSDEIDALAVARAVVKDGIERFAAAHLDEQAMEIRLLSDHRKDLVAERTRIQNRLRWHLLELCPELEQSLQAARAGPARTAGPHRPAAAPPARPARACGSRANRSRSIRELTRQIDALERELRDARQGHRPQLLAETGCGPLTAAILIGRTAGAERFRSDASFARLAGTAPIPCSSGQRDRHRLHRGGDRQLNHALHIIAITRARDDPDTKAYLARKASRRQDQARSAPLPQTPPRPPLSPSALNATPAPSARPLDSADVAPVDHLARPDRRQRCSRAHAMHRMRIPLRAQIA